MPEPRKIKILATVGPVSWERDTIKNMDYSGVDIFRINLSHTKVKDFASVVKKIRAGTDKAICVDTEGAQIRTGKVAIKLKNNRMVRLVKDGVRLTDADIPLYPVDPYKILEVGDILSIDFNSAIVQVVEKKDNEVKARVVAEGEIGSNKGVSCNRPVILPAFTKKDLQIFGLAKKIGLTHFALSFASSEDNVEKLRSFFPYRIFVISKIESRFGLASLKEICNASDAILIDRGDLSREVSLEKIAIAQKHILDVAKKLGTPVYVATNLLESMVTNFRPTRAEINDITSTLIDGAGGLVLAAETAIGKHPVQSVRMASDIKKEVEKWQGSKNYFDSICDYDLIEPHGGELVQNFIDFRDEAGLAQLPKIDVDDRTLSDVIQISEGAYSPLKGFMNFEELISVLENYKLPGGQVWTLPILLQMNKKDINFSNKDTVAIRREEDKKIYGVLKVREIKRIDVSDVAKKWFGTYDKAHPGVANFISKGNYIVGGEVFLAGKPASLFDSYKLSPKQSRQIFKDHGWKKIVGFHTRNVIHRGHEFIQRKALEATRADALFISPVVGQKKKNDFSAPAILKSYETMLKNNFYDPYPALLGTFSTYSRYSGPREAVFTAICRKNLGCSHFVIGRDHTGVGSFYAPDASQRIFDKIGDIGIAPLMFDAAYYCQVCKKVTDNCRHSKDKRLSLSGTEVRKHLTSDEKVPEYLVRKEIFDALKEMSQDPKSKLFEE